MQEFRTLDDILDYAILREEQAAKMYAELADTVSRPGMRETFLEFAAEEGRHKARLLQVKAGDLPSVTVEQVQDLKITETLAPVEPNPVMTYAEALAYAMRSEKEAFKLYSSLAALSPPALAEVFRTLAQEEAKHKLRFELEYDDHVLEGV